MKRFFQRQRSSVVNPDSSLTLDFGSAAEKMLKVFDPEFYELKILSARILQRGENFFVVLDLVENDTGCRVDTRPIWIAGPSAFGGDLVARNQHLIGRLLEIAGQPTAGEIGVLIPELADLSFNGRLVLAIDNRTGRTLNELADALPGEAT